MNDCRAEYLNPPLDRFDCTTKSRIMEHNRKLEFNLLVHCPFEVGLIQSMIRSFS